ncbi:hypothetical protein [Nocardia sp. NBC_00881]|uniref:hypothetical protein n=1 Tax=Nocardia sp. NBC_00881 TaxID=2975995 RepID=UPI003865E9D3
MRNNTVEADRSRRLVEGPTELAQRQMTTGATLEHQGCTGPAVKVCRQQFGQEGRTGTDRDVWFFVSVSTMLWSAG